MSNYEVPIINLSDYRLSEIQQKQLRLGLEYSFVNKNQGLKKIFTANLETIANQALLFVNQTKLQNFHEFLLEYTDIFTKTLHATKD